MRRALAVAVALGVLILSGLVHGLWTDRWVAQGQTEAHVARLRQVPASVGEWDSKDVELDKASLEMAQITGYLARTYVQRRTGATVSVALVCGRPGPISVHTPDVCYSGLGHNLVAPPTLYRVASPEGTDQLWTARFHKDDSAVPVYLRIFWAWNATGTWTASSQPRLEFARYPALYKLYVVHELATPDEPVEKDAAVEFLPLFLEQLRQELFTDPSPEHHS